MDTSIRWGPVKIKLTIKNTSQEIFPDEKPEDTESVLSGFSPFNKWRQ